MTAGPHVATVPLSHDSVPLPLRYFDCVLVLAFLPFGLLAGMPTAGVLVGVFGWIAQRAVGAGIDHAAARQPDVRTATGLTFAGSMGRPLLAGITILVVGQVGEKKDGLTAALIMLVAFTVYLALSVIFRPKRNSST
jgi:hypothetical protein